MDSRFQRHGGPRVNRSSAGMRWLVIASLWTGSLAASAATLDEARAALRRGKHAEVIESARAALDGKGGSSEDWTLLQARALMDTGRYPEARDLLTNAVAEVRRSVRLRWLGRTAALAAGDTNTAAALVDDIRTLINAQAADLREPRARVALAEAAFLLGADPKTVLEKLLQPLRQSDPGLAELHLARGNIALEKHDAALAAQAFQEGVQKQPDDPDLHHGLARSHMDGDRAVLVESLENALRINERHVPSLLLLVDYQIDAEDYAEAAKNLDLVDQVNPVHPEAWAYRAVLAHLRNDAQAETEARAKALQHWPTNPRVDHLIGLKLSRKYRFAEGASRQRQALAFAPDYLPAKSALASDLLRLGEEEEGWKLAHEVHRDDAYDVAAFNLVTLHDSLGRYSRLTNEHFVVRIASKEAAIYGQKVLELLTRARATLAAKYGVEPVSPTFVEVFAEQKDFGVRTFGIPENPGFLGVCFGRVITANGPAATRGRDSNWEAVLWHEFTHVVTLQATANRMPRWLSEGISVHEELQANPSWGQRFNPRYRSMIVGDDLVPVSKLSGAFLAPKSPFHLQFAYFQSALVVDYVLATKGNEALRAVLRDLRDGTPINDALARHVAPLPDLEKGFKEFAVNRAKGVAPDLDWTKPPAAKPGEPPPPPVAEWGKDKPRNFYVLDNAARRAVAGKDWEAALKPLRTLVESFPEHAGADSAYPLLARVHRQLGQTNEEQRVLVSLAERDHEAPDAYLRLMEMSAATRDWPEVLRNARRFLAVNPLVPAPYRLMAQAAEQTGDRDAALQAFQTLLLLDPPNPADAHFQVARLLRDKDPSGARRHVLQALEEAPRHRKALQLLLELQPKEARGGSGKEASP